MENKTRIDFKTTAECGPSADFKKTLRDEFAMYALQGYRCQNYPFAQIHTSGQLADHDTISKWAYADADAMLEARKAMERPEEIVESSTR